MSLLARLFGGGNKGRSRQITLELERLEGRILLSGGGLGDQQVAGEPMAAPEPLGMPAKLVIEHGMVKANHKWKTVQFSENFTDPVVVAGPASYYAWDPGVVRLRAVRAASFKVRFQEWNYLNGPHKAEKINWLAVERGTWDLGGDDQLIARTLKTGNTNMNSPKRVDFPSAFSSRPVVLAQVQTCNDPAAVTDRISGVRPARFKLALQEEEAGGAHGRETVGYIAAYIEPNGVMTQLGLDGGGVLEGVNHTRSQVPDTLWQVWVSEEKSADNETRHAGEDVGFISFGRKAGVVADLQTANSKDTANLRCASFRVEQATVRARHRWVTVDFDKSFGDPVVVAGPATNNDSIPGVVRMKQVAPTSFKVRFQEWNYLDGLHAAEKIHWVAFERGTWDLGNGDQIVAGTLKTGNTNMDSPTRVSFSTAFSSRPVVIAQVQTYNDPAAVTDRISVVKPSRFKVALQEEEAGGVHNKETVGYIAGYVGPTGNTNLPCIKDAGVISGVTHSHSSVPGTAWEVWVSEEKSADKETRHRGEEVGYLSFGGATGFIADMQTVNNTDTAILRYQ